jgi:N-acetylglucosamine-6-sulfatase
MRLSTQPVGLSLLVALFLTGCAHTGGIIKPTPAADRPNILILVSDDQTYNQMLAMPHTQEMIFDQGVSFEHAYDTTPQCCPSRSTILTGMYAHNHGVLTNVMHLDKTTVVERLHESGYYTGLVGKYLNTYPEANDPPLPEFDYWIAMVDGGKTGSYFDLTLNINGEWIPQKGYQTFLLRDYALEFLDEAHKSDQPFFLMFTPRVPHRPALPAPGDEDLFSDVPANRPPSFNEEDISDKPEWMQQLPLLSDKQITDIDNVYRNQLQTLKPLDDSIDAILQKLDEQGELDNTFIIYLSDNGRAAGQHRLRGGKVFAYEPITRVPFAIRYTPLITSPHVETRVVANIDIAPTLYELAGIPIPREVDGLSLIPLLREQTEWRDRIMIEAWPQPSLQAPPYLAVHTERYVYIETEGQRSEFYDLETDPDQVENQNDNPIYADLIAGFKSYLAEERKHFPPITPIFEGLDDEDSQ